MCPLANMVFDGSVENIFVYLDRHKPGSPLPEGLFEGINPYQHRPSNLPVGIWHLVNLTEGKENDFGIWEVKEEASEIFTNSFITGWRTTLQFYEYKDSLEHRNNWVMHEYKIRLKDLSAANKEKEARSICRVFLSATRSSDTEKPAKSKGYTKVGRDIVHIMVSIFPRADTNSKKGSTSGSLDKKEVDGMELLSEAHMFDGDYLELDDLSDPMSCFSDYMELDDLADPLSRSSSSDNSSLSSLNPDEYFDPNTFLQELEDINSRGQQGKDASSKFSVTSSVKPFVVVVQQDSSGSLVSSAERKISRKEGRDTNLAPTAYNTNPTTSKGKKKAAFFFFEKNRLDHLCFMPFKKMCKTF